MANLKLNNVVVVTESAGAATVQSGIFKAKDGTAAFTIADSTGAVALSSTLAVTGTTTLTGATTITGDLTVNGTTTTLNSTTLTIDDKNMELGSVATPSDTTADGGGFTLKGATDKTITWTNATDAWHFNQGINVTSGSVGVGTAAADNNVLHVEGNASTTGIALFSGTADVVYFRDTGAGTGLKNWGLQSTGGSFNINTHNDSFVGQSTKMTFLTGGNVGIGTTTPGARTGTTANVLEVYNSYGTAFDAADPNDYGATIAIHNHSDVADTASTLLFTHRSSSTGYAGISSLSDGGDKANLLFFTRHNSPNTITERMRIDYNGFVGIGTTSPDNNFDVDASGGQFIIDGDGGIESYQKLDTSTAGLQLRSYSNGGNTKQLLGALKIYQTTTGNRKGYATISVDNGSSLVERLRVDGDRIKSGGVSVQYYGGYTAGNASVSHEITNLNNPNAVRVRAQFTHHAVQSYGCIIDAIYGYYAGHGGLQSTHTIHNTTSGGGGYWNITRSGSGPMYVTKEAGSYAGGGYYSIEVITGH